MPGHEIHVTESLLYPISTVSRIHVEQLSQSLKQRGQLDCFVVGTQFGKLEILGETTNIQLGLDESFLLDITRNSFLFVVPIQIEEAT